MPVRPERRAAVEEELARLDADVERTFGGSSDADRATEADHQGLGGATALERPNVLARTDAVTEARSELAVDELERLGDVVAERQSEVRSRRDDPRDPDDRQHRDQRPDDLVAGRAGV